MPDRKDADEFLRAAKVSKSFGRAFGGNRVKALDGADLVLREGEVCGLVGPNGAGKSTLIKTIVGTERMDSGTIHIASGEARAIGFVPERPVFFEDLSALKNLRYFADLTGTLESEKTCLELLERFGLGKRKDDPISGFSKGMRQRLAIARALVHSPSLLLLDEPFSGLDPSMSMSLRQAIISMKGSGITMLLSSHELADVQAICDTVAFMKNGRIVRKIKVGSLVSDHVELEIRFAERFEKGLRSIDIELAVKEESELSAVISLRAADVPKLVTKLTSLGAAIAEVRTLNRDLSSLYSEIIMREDDGQEVKTE